ncbi:hypothetical protein B0T09DRAFT_405291 [Sordaria sp. MPI-SDFR-AT-0083]|nr:hypothetical protein B0T09DRAFT_405291 [Sordaria sp. MPI-SDFR-AT-0083]
MSNGLQNCTLYQGDYILAQIKDAIYSPSTPVTTTGLVDSDMIWDMGTNKITFNKGCYQGQQVQCHWVNNLPVLPVLLPEEIDQKYRRQAPGLALMATNECDALKQLTKASAVRFLETSPQESQEEEKLDHAVVFSDQSVEQVEEVLQSKKKVWTTITDSQPKEPRTAQPEDSTPEVILGITKSNATITTLPTPSPSTMPAPATQNTTPLPDAPITSSLSPTSPSLRSTTPSIKPTSSPVKPIKPSSGTGGHVTRRGFEYAYTDKRNNAGAMAVNTTGTNILQPFNNNGDSDGEEKDEEHEEDLPFDESFVNSSFVDPHDIEKEKPGTGGSGRGTKPSPNNDSLWQTPETSSTNISRYDQ